MLEQLESLTEREKRLLEFMRRLGWGEVLLRIEEGQPVLIREAIRTYKLVDEEKANKRRTAPRVRVWRGG
ncbi:MAG: hypothetical protein IBX71_06380 [Candidatus Desulforudis sp.]|nr:hypothetical protein [Desulforudis sp.]